MSLFGNSKTFKIDAVSIIVVLIFAMRLCLDVRFFCQCVARFILWIVD